MASVLILVCLIAVYHGTSQPPCILMVTLQALLSNYRPTTVPNMSPTTMDPLLQAFLFSSNYRLTTVPNMSLATMDPLFIHCSLLLPKVMAPPGSCYLHLVNWIMGLLQFP